MNKKLVKKSCLFLVIVLLFSIITACTPSENPETSNPESKNPSVEPTDAPTEKPVDELTLDTIKIGFIHHTDPSDQEYVLTLNYGVEKMKED